MAHKQVHMLTIGGAMRDIFIEYQAHKSVTLDAVRGVFLQEGRKIEIDALSYCPGGGAANSAVSYARLGCAVSIICMVGADQEGDFIKKNLAAEGVQDTYITATTQARTGTSFIIPTLSGNRVVLVYRGANTLLSEKNISSAALSATDYVYCTSLGKANAHMLPFIVDNAKKMGKKVAINPGTGQMTHAAESVKKALPYI
ncbi:MAG TPA: carbohydrate kinase family protein, partial [Candidatus Bathyarchaeia archaeon]|nr:carbohydrate kinase family protein [Candidatus Bathyarchaeia archaeon]